MLQKLRQTVEYCLKAEPQTFGETDFKTFAKNSLIVVLRETGGLCRQASKAVECPVACFWKFVLIIPLLQAIFSIFESGKWTHTQACLSGL